MAAEGVAVEDLDAPALSPGMRRVVDRCLDATDDLIALARTLPGRLKSRRLAMESAAIVHIAARLSTHLRRRDPLAERVELSKPAFAWCCAKGVVGSLF
jgi:phytoene/squalene synthetase